MQIGANIVRIEATCPLQSDIPAKEIALAQFNAVVT